MRAGVNVAYGLHVAKAAGAPDKTIWTREDDVRGGYYRPAWLHRLRASLDAAGAPSAWHQTIVGQKQSNFHDYRMLRTADMPRVEAHVVPREEKSGGAGEPGVPPVAPAVANAVFALTGKRLRRLPLRLDEGRRS